MQNHLQLERNSCTVYDKLSLLDRMTICQHPFYMTNEASASRGAFKPDVARGRVRVVKEIAICCIGAGIAGLLGVAYCTWMQRKERGMYRDFPERWQALQERIGIHLPVGTASLLLGLEEMYGIEFSAVPRNQDTAEVEAAGARTIDHLNFHRWRYVHGDLTEHPSEEAK